MSAYICITSSYHWDPIIFFSIPHWSMCISNFFFFTNFACKYYIDFLWNGKFFYDLFTIVNMWKVNSKYLHVNLLGFWISLNFLKLLSKTFFFKRNYFMICTHVKQFPNFIERNSNGKFIKTFQTIKMSWFPCKFLRKFILHEKSCRNSQNLFNRKIWLKIRTILKEILKKLKIFHKIFSKLIF